MIPKLNKSSKPRDMQEDFLKGRLAQTNEQTKLLKKLIDEIRSKLNTA